MTDETDNLASAGTDGVEPLTIDSPEALDFFDPEVDNEEDQKAEGTDDEAAETQTEDEAELAETEEGDAETADDEDEKAPLTASEDAVVELADGTTLTVRDLIAGNMRQADYTRKSQANAEYRSQVEATATRIESISTALADKLAEMVPPEPDPLLAHTNPSAFNAQQAQHAAAMAQVNKIIESAEAAKATVAEMTDNQRRAIVREESAKLGLMFPETLTEAGRRGFFDAAASAAKDIGFSQAELDAVTDHRLFALAHWAQKGMRAEKARAEAKAKAKKAPPAAPVKPGNAGRPARANADAMRQLKRSGSMQDALRVETD